MGNVFGNNLSAEESIQELEFRESLVKKYFKYSSSTNNLMGYKCCKTKIPGKEINSIYTFYLYNIEGFFDFENGFFFTLHNLIWIMICFNENNIDTKSYKDFSCKLKIFLNFLEAGNPKHKNINVKNFKEFMEYLKKEDELIKIASLGMTLLRNSNYVINFLESIIPFDQFKGYVSSVFQLIEGGLEIFGGIRDLANLSKAIINKNYYEAAIYLLDGTVNFFKGGDHIRNSYRQLKQNYREKKFTKAQRNLNTLLNKMDKLFIKLKENNLNKLYKKNVIVLAIDETNRFMEDPDIGLINVEGIEYYAKSLDENDVNRNKFTMNMIFFYMELKNIISSDEFENKDFKLRYGFMIYLKKILLRQYNLQLWNSMNEENIIHLINDKYKEYYDDLNELDDNKREIDEKEKIVKKTNYKNTNEIIEQKVLVKSSSISSYSFNKKNENKIIKEEKKNHNNFNSTCAKGFYKKKIVHKNTNNTSSKPKLLSKSEMNCCKIESVKNEYKISKKTYNFKGYRDKYKRKNESKSDEISCQDLSSKNSAPPVGIYYKKVNNFK